MSSEQKKDSLEGKVTAEWSAKDTSEEAGEKEEATSKADETKAAETKAAGTIESEAGTVETEATETEVAEPRKDERDPGVDEKRIELDDDTEAVEVPGSAASGGKKPEDEAPSAFERKMSRFFEKVGLVVTAVLCFLLLSECTTRVLDRLINKVPFWGADEANVLYKEHPFLFRVPRQNAQFQVYKVNSHGFRGREFKIPKPDNVFRILTMGGSAAWDTNVSSSDTTWTAQMEDILNKRNTNPAVRFEGINGGVPGYSSAETVMNFIWRGIHVDPNAVIIYQGYNDFKPNRWPGFKPDYSHFRSRDHSLWMNISRSWRLFFYMRRFLSRYRVRREKRYDTVSEPGILAFKENLRRVVVLARDRKIQPILATFAMSLTMENKKNHPKELRSMDRLLPTLTFKGAMDAHKRYNKAVVELAAELMVPLADIEAAVPKDFKHFTDHCHMSDTGSRRAAERFADVILSRLKLPAPAPADAR